MKEPMKKNSNELKTVAFKIHPKHKALIKTACAAESRRIGRAYGLAEYFRDSALHFAGKLGSVAEYEYTRGRPAEDAA